MKKYFDVLRKCPLFYNIAGDDLRSMLACLGAKIAIYNKKEIILAEGDPAFYIGILLCGTARIERTDYYGNRSIVAHVEPGELFGESFACAESEKIPVDVIATESCEVMLIDCKRVINSCGNACAFHNQMIFNLLKVVAIKNIVLNQKVEVCSKRTTREKLMTYLSLHAKRTGCRSFTIPYDRQQLSDYLEVDRSGLSAEISKLRREGIIESRKNHFKLL